MANQRTAPVDELHPFFHMLLNRLGLAPPGDATQWSMAALVEATHLALSLLSEDVQLQLIGRIMTPEDQARRRLASEELQDMSSRTVLSKVERRVALRQSAVLDTPTQQGEDIDYLAPQEQECIVCTEAAMLALPCGCFYCYPCLRALVRHGLQSEIDFPPQCCHALREETVMLARRPALVHLFRQLQAEHSQLPAERVYCWQEDCQAIIPPTNIVNDIAKCVVCDSGSDGGGTCAKCRAKVHPGLPCDLEQTDEEKWDWMDEQGIVGCPECRTALLLRDGCNHITCAMCGTEFCYLCGTLWHEECLCPLYGSFQLRVPIRSRPGEPPAMTAAVARHIVQEEKMVLPQLSHDPEGDLALYALLDEIPIPADARNPEMDAPVDDVSLANPSRRNRHRHRDHEEGDDDEARWDGSSESESETDPGSSSSSEDSVLTERDLARLERAWDRFNRWEQHRAGNPRTRGDHRPQRDRIRAFATRRQQLAERYVYQEEHGNHRR